MKVFISLEELLKIDNWSLSFIEMPSSPFMAMLVTLVLILFPILLMIKMIVNREGQVNIFPMRPPNNPPQQNIPPVQQN